MRNELKAFRAARKISQGQLAIAVGVSRQTIYALENDRSEPSLAVALALARYFTRPVESVFHEDTGDSPIGASSGRRV
ncbi:helix-turn-helix transcriptional regulator [Kocuria sp. KH4]